MMFDPTTTTTTTTRRRRRQQQGSSRIFVCRRHAAVAIVVVAALAVAVVSLALVMIAAEGTSSSSSSFYVHSLSITTTTTSSSSSRRLRSVSSMTRLRPPLSVTVTVTGPLFASSSSRSPTSSSTTSSSSTQEEDQDDSNNNELIGLSTVSATQVAVLDGPEWTSVQSVFLKQQKQKQLQKKDGEKTKTKTSAVAAEGGRKQQTKLGVIQVVAGVLQDDNNKQQRVVGILSSNVQKNNSNKMQILIDRDSVANIPARVSDADAISTYLASISSVYCAARPSTSASASGRERVAVVLGSSDLAQFSAQGLSSLGYTTWIVSKDGKKFSDLQNVKCISPAMDVDDDNDSEDDDDDDDDDQQQGFAAHIGQFDALVDTIGNEQSTMLSLDDDDEDESDDDSFFPTTETSFGGSVLQLLKTRHSCSKYVSTVTHSQTLVAKDGIFSGPRQVDKYCQDVSKRIPIQTINTIVDGQSNGKNAEWQHVTSLDGIGETITKLLANGVIYEQKQRRKICNDKAYDGNAIRGWSLADFWEQTSWPRDSSGTSTTRYGLPVREDPYEETDARFLVSESPFRRENFQRVDMSEEEELSNGGYPVGVSGGSTTIEETSRGGGRGVQENPYVLNIVGVAGVESEIMEQQKDCIMFLSARFCKTCKTINPVYTRMARLNQENNDDDDDDDETNEICFIKAEASGALGKELGRYLSVDAVPAFVLYRKGKRFGIPLSVSKLPSRKIDRAISLLKSGEDWDFQYVTGDEE